MKKKIIEFRSECPISMALDIFGDKWSLLIIRDMIFNEKKSYGDFINSDEKIATNILADRLNLLECAGIISKNKHPENKVKVVYKLSQKGIDLLPTLVEIIVWSEKHHEVHPFAKEFVKAIKNDKEDVIKGISDQLKLGLETD